MAFCPGFPNLLGWNVPGKVASSDERRGCYWLLQLPFPPLGIWRCCLEEQHPVNTEMWQHRGTAFVSIPEFLHQPLASWLLDPINNSDGVAGSAVT